MDSKIKYYVALIAISFISICHSEDSSQHPLFRGKVWMCPNDYYIQAPIIGSESSNRSVNQWFLEDQYGRGDFLNDIFNNKENYSYLSSAQIDPSNAGVKLVENSTVIWNDNLPLRRYIFFIPNGSDILKDKEKKEAFVEGLMRLSEEQILNQDSLAYKLISHKVIVGYGRWGSEQADRFYPKLQYFHYESKSGTSYLSVDSRWNIYDGKVEFDPYKSIPFDSKNRTLPSPKRIKFYCKNNIIVQKGIVFLTRKTENQLGESSVHQLVIVEYADRMAVKFVQ